MINLSSLDEHFSKKGPSTLEFIYYLFFKRGIPLDKFNELPIPYILSMVNTHSYIKEEQNKEIKKSQRKK